jgi:chorismate-pyruvate lyase
LDGAAAFHTQPVALADLPNALELWVFLQGSMTQAIAEHFRMPPVVEVHYSDESSLQTWEARLLRLDNITDTGFARHISLNVGGKPRLAARSATAANSTLVPLLSELQTTPLAKLLFEDPDWQRLDEPLPIILPSGYFGRACTWQYQPTGERLLVEEFFLFTEDLCP